MKTRPSFNTEDENKPLYCATHKKDNMINVVSKTCLFNNCIKQSCFNYEDESKPLYCFDHKDD
jgi:hypothetical protein